jgi:DNA helicase II / ATP-dependent DNA helicase PcrA
MHKADHDDLSETQRLAIGWGEGAFLLLAGPGSGKTSVLTRRVIRLLQESPDRSFKVLALTFTNRAADEMRSRVEETLPAGNRLLIGTFHAFAADVLRQAGQNLGLRADFKIYSSDEDRADVLGEAMKALDASTRDKLKGTSLLSTFDRAGSLLLTPKGLESRLLNKEINQQIASAYDAYHRYMLSTNVQDFTSLVLNAYRLFEKYPALSKRYRQVYRYWNIDEFQDTTYAQFQLLKTVAGSAFKNIFAVADDDQIIFQWNGASYQRIQEYIQDFEPTVLQLPANYRCPESIVAIANRLISNNKLRQPGKQPLIAARAASNALRDGEITLLVFDDESEEAAGIADHIAANPQCATEATVVLARVRSSLELVQAACASCFARETAASSDRAAPGRFSDYCVSLDPQRLARGSEAHRC